jgi:hypothetical protein
MDARWLCIVAGAVALGSLPTRAAAQEPQQRADSLGSEIRALRASLDSLQRVLEELIRAGDDTTVAVDELAALRAAAAATAQEVPRDTVPERQVIRSRSLNRLNPEISVTGDVRLKANRPGPQDDNVDVREVTVLAVKVPWCRCEVSTPWMARQCATSSLRRVPMPATSCVRGSGRYPRAYVETERGHEDRHYHL